MKSKIRMSSNHLFQVPFTKIQIKNYKGISDVYTNDCLFHTLTSLGLRHPSISYQDSMKMYKIKGDGVRIDHAGDYISSIFDTEIDMVKHIGYKLSDLTSKLKNGYATIVCGAYEYGIIKKTIFGHFFIIYKEKNEIYIYNPQDKNSISKSYCQTKSHQSQQSHLIKSLKYIIAYYNKNKIAAPLNKDRLNNAIPF